MKNKSARILPFVLVLALLLAFSLAGCAKQEDVPAADNDAASKFTFEAYDLSGNATTFEMVAATDDKTVGDVLVKAGLISGDDSQYGLYVKTVNGITLDYDKDKMYWAFYIDGEYAMTGVDSTPIQDGSVYAFKPEK